MGCTTVCPGCESKKTADTRISKSTRDWFSKASVKYGCPENFLKFLDGYKPDKRPVITWFNNFFYNFLSDKKQAAIRDAEMLAQPETIRGAKVLALIEVLKSTDDLAQQTRAGTSLLGFFCEPKLESIVTDAVGNNEAHADLILGSIGVLSPEKILATKKLEADAAVEYARSLSHAWGGPCNDVEGVSTAIRRTKEAYGVDGAVDVAIELGAKLTALKLMVADAREHPADSLRLEKADAYASALINDPDFRYVGGPGSHYQPDQTLYDLLEVFNLQYSLFANDTHNVRARNIAISKAVLLEKMKRWDAAAETWNCAADHFGDERSVVKILEKGLIAVDKALEVRRYMVTNHPALVNGIVNDDPDTALTWANPSGEAQLNDLKTSLLNRLHAGA
ncbi:Uncharacterised protein [Candidatus Burarchaeum australiense]|nr:Uncharacterised protein [Candidatus Burarchaeum australiense]